VPLSDDWVASQRVEAGCPSLSGPWPSGHLTAMTKGAERLTYEIRVRGELTDALIAALQALSLHIEQTESGTILIGVFRDQAELHGALQDMQDFGVELVEVRQK
jgi:hypothetical protein